MNKGGRERTRERRQMKSRVMSCIDCASYSIFRTSLTLGFSLSVQTACRYCAQAKRYSDFTGDSYGEVCGTGSGSADAGSMRVELKWQGRYSQRQFTDFFSYNLQVPLHVRVHLSILTVFTRPNDFCAAISFVVNKRGKWCHVNRIRRRCGGVTIGNARVIDRVSVHLQ